MGDAVAATRDRDDVIEWPHRPSQRALQSQVPRTRNDNAQSSGATDALGRTGPGARELEEITDAQLAELAIGTGVSIEQMRGMNIATVMRCLTENIQIWLLTEEGRDGLAQIRTTLRLMVSRGR